MKKDTVEISPSFEFLKTCLRKYLHLLACIIFSKRQNPFIYPEVEKISGNHLQKCNELNERHLSPSPSVSLTTIILAMDVRMDVVYALKRQGRTLYGFGGKTACPPTNKRFL